jgi:pSer/pThr/pTyr-binding forkhead associated (FHA) protein
MAARVVVSLNGDILMEAEIAKPVTVVGRHPACDVVIDNPHVSGRHMLFRLVNRTVYAEDLASTNGMLINGIAASHQVVHHLDLIELGRHKLHFFDDAMLSGAVGNLENTVVTEYERTMMAVHVPTLTRAAPPPAPPAPPAAAAKRPDDDLARTRMIARDPSLALPQPLEETRPGVAAGTLALRVVAGEGAGEVIALDRPNTMIGAAGTDTALVVRRGKAWLIARLSGTRPLRLNRNELGPGTHPLTEHDVIEVGGSSFEVILAAT